MVSRTIFGHNVCFYTHLENKFYDAPFFLSRHTPYPTDPVKNDLLLYATQIVQNSSGAINQVSLRIFTRSNCDDVRQNHYLGLSVVAMSMAANAVYGALFQALDVCKPKPMMKFNGWSNCVLVAGCNQAVKLSLDAPSIELAACLANYPHTRALTHAHLVVI